MSNPAKWSTQLQENQIEQIFLRLVNTTDRVSGYPGDWVIKVGPNYCIPRKPNPSFFLHYILYRMTWENLVHNNIMIKCLILRNYSLKFVMDHLENKAVNPRYLVDMAAWINLAVTSLQMFQAQVINNMTCSGLHELFFQRSVPLYLISFLKQGRFFVQWFSSTRTPFHWRHGNLQSHKVRLCYRDKDTKCQRFWTRRWFGF